VGLGGRKQIGEQRRGVAAATWGGEAGEGSGEGMEAMRGGDGSGDIFWLIFRRRGVVNGCNYGINQKQIGSLI
jgi:hypothetical protein